MSEETTPRRKRFGFLALFAVLILGVIGGGIATSAFGHGPGMGMHRWGGHHRMHGPMNPERAQRHAEHMVKFLSWSVDATPEQKQKLNAIAQGLVKELMPVHEKLRAGHKKAHDLLLQPKTDRVALEALRVEHLALADEVSKKITAGLADAADVLTPEQRAKLAQHWDN